MMSQQAIVTNPLVKKIRYAKGRSSQVFDFLFSLSIDDVVNNLNLAGFNVGSPAHIKQSLIRPHVSNILESCARGCACPVVPRVPMTASHAVRRMNALKIAFTRYLEESDAQLQADKMGRLRDNIHRLLAADVCMPPNQLMIFKLKLESLFFAADAWSAQCSTSERQPL
ncbi:hypothetical protein [Marinagarivorans cellulosilyticus]|uniref:Uncharacterized protein n=1 Tax=Marinagarivorans cellulosilyticus TaxID=2721545 RepID=A0AAN1WHH5_9GAMM|nr:hypothetical protein [Marinagarivorans cellulosilyticus]BCD97687.1 hypothetical protein MARGE09_P1888 [Marinagarivorans cellulosilyticus]